MKIIKGLFFSLALLGLTSCSDDDNVEVKEFDNYTAQLSQLNDSGASGTAAISMDDNLFTVVVEAKGMVPNMAHPQHIHGLSDKTENATCPPASADTDGDGIITIPEGAPFYGELLLPLDDFPTADENGNISYQRTFKLGENGNPTKEELANIENRVIVLHGLNNDGSYEATIPVACGEFSMIE